MTQPKSPFDTLFMRMHHLGMTKSSPGWQIVVAAKLLPPTPKQDRPVGDNDTAALKKLMKSFYEYGRKNWSWVPSSPGSAANGGLVLGKTKAVACASFNGNFRWLAENALDIAGITLGEHKGGFLTVPGAACIDHKWAGNVRTDAQDFKQFKCFKFTSHYWAVHKGVGYDVCFNKIMQGKSMWMTLLAPEGQVTASTGLSEGALYKLGKAQRWGDYLLMVEKNGVNGWPEYQICPHDKLPQRGA